VGNATFSRADAARDSLAFALAVEDDVALMKLPLPKKRHTENRATQLIIETTSLASRNVLRININVDDKEAHEIQFYRDEREKLRSYRSRGARGAFGVGSVSSPFKGGDDVDFPLAFLSGV